MSTPAPEHGDAITAALLLMTQHAERLAVLDEREAGHCRDTGERLAELARLAAETSARLDDVHATAARQAAILDTLDGLDRHVAALADRLSSMTTAQDADVEDGQKYRPAAATRWWKLDGDEREKAITRLRAWVEQVYRPSYGHLAAALGRCWELHPLCFYGLDWLMELWSVLYLTGERNGPVLTSQAEWQTRLLPALAEQMHVETTRCQHAQTASGQRQPYPGALAADHSMHRHPAGTPPPRHD